MAVAVVLVGISGGVRFWRDLQFQTLAQAGAVCPFRLKDLNRTLGTWQSIEQFDGKLEPEIARIAGSSDHIVRVYTDEKTGEQVTALVLYGLAHSVFGHIPEICYPSAGFIAAGAPVDQQFTTSDSKTPVRFRKAFYTKNLDASGPYDEVCYTFLHNGEWLPDVSGRWKMFRSHPGIFKVQLQRRASKMSNDPSSLDSFLNMIVQEVAVHVSQDKAKSPPAAVATTR